MAVEFTEEDILPKIGHPIADIRTRALHSLMFKLSNQIIQPYDLANNKSFLRSLLEWFNNDHWECETMVIYLIERLSYLETAAQHFVAIGAIEFLSELRPHLDVGMHNSIDNILQQLLQLPAFCLQLKNHLDDNSVVNNNQPNSQTDYSYPSQSSCDDSQKHSKRAVYLYDDSTQTNTDKRNHYSLHGNTSNSFKTDCIDNVSSQQFDFEWIPLSKVDNQILSTTISRLMSSSSNIKQISSFINNTMFADFPPCIFLQRPKLLQVTLDHLTITEAATLSHDMSVIASVLDILLTFTQKLNESVKRSNDILTHDLMDGLSAKNNNNVDSAIVTATDLECLSNEAFIALKSNQLYITDFVELVFSRVPKILLLLIDSHLPWLHSSFDDKSCDSEDILPNILVAVVTIGMKLLMSAVNLDLHDKRENVQRKVSSSIHHLSITLSQLTSKMRRARESLIVPYNFLKLLSPLMFTCGTCFSLLLSNNILKEHCLSSLSPASVASLKDIFADSVLSVMCQSHLNNLLPILQCVDKGTAKLYLKEQKLIDSFKHIYIYHKAVSDAKLAILEKCLCGMYLFFGDYEVKIVIAAVKNIIECISNETCSSSVVTQCQNVLVQLVSHGNQLVSNTAYQSLKENIHSPTFKENVILSRVYTPQLIKQLCCYDIHNDNTSSICVLSWWLRHFHLYTKKDAKRIRTLLTSMLPYIECCASHSSDIFTLLLKLLSESSFDILSSSERLFSFCRLMFSESKDVRLISADYLVKYLPLPLKTLLSSNSSVPFHNVAITISTTKSIPFLSPKFKVKSSSIFKKEDIVKLLSVIKSSLDCSLIQSALEQCVVLLQDTTLHDIAIEEGLLTVLVQLLHSQTNGSKEIAVSLIKPTISCLLMMSLSSIDIRNALCTDNNLILHLLYFISICSDDSDCIETKQLISLLVFSTVIDFKNTNSRVAISSPLLDWFVFPFDTNPISYHSTTKPDSYIDETLLSSVPLRRRLLLHYSLISIESIDNIPIDITGLGAAIVSNDFKFDDSITSEEKCATMFDMQSLIYTRPHYWTVSTNHNTKLLNNLENLITIAHAVSVVTLLCCENPNTRFTFNMKVTFQKFLLPVDGAESVIPDIVIKLLSLCLEYCDVIDFNWVCESVTDKNSLCVSLLRSILSVENWNEDQRCYVESFVELYSVLLLSDYIDECPVHVLELIYLTVEAVSDYDVSFLHKVLEPMVHATAKIKYIPTTHLITLCTHIMNLLVKILQMWLNDRGTMLSSFMGKMAHKNAALSLSQIMSTSREQEWLISWLKSFTSNCSFSWLQTLLYDRDPEIRYSGYCVLCELCSQPLSIAIELCNDIHTNGLVGLCLDIGLNSSESNLIRQQVLRVLICLLITCSDHNIVYDMIKCTDGQKNIVTGSCAISILMSNGDIIQTFSHLLRSLVNCLDTFTDAVCDSNSRLTNFQSDYDDKNKELLAIFIEFHSSCNPQVMSTLCQLICVYLQLNTESTVVVNNDTTELLTKTINNIPLKTVHLLNKKNLLSDAVVTVWFELYSGIVSLIQCCVRIKTVQINTMETCTRSVKLLNLREIIADNHNMYNHLCANVVLLLRTSYKHDKKSHVSVMSLFVSNWEIFTELLICVLDRSNNKSLPPFVFVRELVLLMSTILSFVCDQSCNNHVINKLRDELKAVLNMPKDYTPSHNQSNESNSDPITLQTSVNLSIVIPNSCREDYSQLCFILITSNILTCGSYTQQERNILNDLFRKILSLLVCISETAKETALKAGFFETTLEEIKSVYSKITAKSCEKASSKMEIDQIIGNIQFLQNVIFHSNRHKNVLVNLQIVPVLLDIWSLCSVNVSLLRAILKLLVVYTADCHEAQVSLVSHIKRNSNLLNNIIKMASILFTGHKSCLSSKRQSPHSETIVLILQLFSNCVICQECRTIVKRTNFLSTFLLLNPKVCSQSIPITDKINSILTQWMKVLVNITASADGQKMVSQLPGIIDLLCESSKENHLLCLKIIRNLCCYSPIKPLLVSNEKCIQLLMMSLKSADDLQITVAAAAIWSLLYNSVRFRSQLNQSNIQEVLMTCLKVDSNANTALSVNLNGALALLDPYSSKRK